MNFIKKFSFLKNIFTNYNKKNKNIIYLNNNNNNNNNIFFSSNNFNHHVSLFGTTGKGLTTDWEALNREAHKEKMLKKLNDF
jgi:hypothetical protein